MSAQDGSNRGGRPSVIVCGRRFCKGCKHWRHICDFPADRWNPDGTVCGVRHTCRACRSILRRQRFAELTEEERQARRDHRRLLELGVADAITLYAPARPFADAIAAWVAAQERVLGRSLSAQRPPSQDRDRVTIAGLDQLAELAGLSIDTVRRYRRQGGPRFIELGIADRIALALDIPLPLLAEDFKPLPKWLTEQHAESEAA